MLLGEWERYVEKERLTRPSFASTNFQAHFVSIPAHCLLPPAFVAVVTRLPASF